MKKINNMNPEIKAQWLQALRSGKYKQGRLRLRGRTNRFCCLGVLCDVIAPEEWELKPKAFYYNHRDNSQLTPSFSIGAKAWLDSKSLSHLQDLNDNGYSFQEIANLIEEQY